MRFIKKTEFGVSSGWNIKNVEKKKKIFSRSKEVFERSARKRRKNVKKKGKNFWKKIIINLIFREKEKEQRKKAPIIDLSDLEEKMKKIEEIRKKKEAERLAKKELERQEKIEKQETFKYQTNEAFEVYESTLPPAVVSNGVFF